ncbi:MAG TPA: Do family serine endopeptidase, partial [Thiotrichales bacterium]|nr:Do family serine endopeptidase [Thiotrichales bacterium]
PAVVNISTASKVKPQRRADLNGIPEELLRRFFGDAFPIPPGQGEVPRGRGDDNKKEMQSLGTGFIISADGYIITNHHVIADADEITVRFSDRKELSAKVIGSDERTDIALLKVEAKGLPTVTLGQTSKLKVGEWVLAIGSPFGFEATVTQGIVSAKERTLPDDTYVPFIQSDVAINPGNSGGPLFNLAGEVVGINSQIYSRSGGFMGLSFSIPIEVAMNTVDQLKRNGRVIRGYLGVNVQEVTSELSESFGMDKPKGALVTEVFPDTPAAKAGIKAGDIVLSVNGREVNKSGSLPPVIGMTPVGQPVDIKLLRQGRLMNVTVVIDALPDDQKTAKNNKRGGSKEQSVGKIIEGAQLMLLDD